MSTWLPNFKVAEFQKFIVRLDFLIALPALLPAGWTAEPHLEERRAQHNIFPRAALNSGRNAIKLHLSCGANTNGRGANPMVRGEQVKNFQARTLTRHTPPIMHMSRVKS